MVVIIYPEVLKVLSTYKVIRPIDVYKELIYIYYKKDVPINIKERGFFSLYIEWLAHNMLYYLGYKRERTADVDYDNEPMKHRVLYFLLAFVYWLGFWKIIKMTNHGI